MTEYSDEYLILKAKILFAGFEHYVMIRDEYGNRQQVGMISGIEIKKRVDCHEIYLLANNQKK